MDPVDVQRTRVGTGHAVVVPEETMATPVRATTPVMAPVAPTTGYAETHVRTTVPLWRRISQAIWLVVGIVDVVLAFDFIFRAFGAHDTGFASLIYGLGNALGAPFDGIFGNVVNNVGNGPIGVDRWADLMAIGIYTLIAVAIIQLVRIATTSRDSVASTSSTVV